jgi:hypothetical protein
MRVCLACAPRRLKASKFNLEDPPSVTIHDFTEGIHHDE